MTETKSHTSHTLKALTLATLALPGVCSQTLASEAEYFDVNTMFSRYSESGNRMKVDAYQAVVNIPISEKFKLKINGSKDIISGASPVFYYRDNGQIKMEKSGASIREIRDAQEITGTYLHGDNSLNIKVGRSSENDYDSNYFNIGSRVELDQKGTFVTTNYGFSSDQVWAVDQCHPKETLNNCINPIDFPGFTPQMNDGMYKRPGVGGDKTSHSGKLGISQIIDENTQIHGNFSYTHNEGYLSDPYKLVFAPGDTTSVIPPFYPHGFRHDTRPENREQFTILGGYVQNFEEFNAAELHLDYRFYADTWGVNAHTFEFSWKQPLWFDWQLTPRARYYSQGSADFYQLYLNDDQLSNKYYSSDYRLASFGAYGGGVQLSKEVFENATLGFGIDFYDRKQSYGMNNTGKGTFQDDYSFSMFSANVKIIF